MNRLLLLGLTTLTLLCVHSEVAARGFGAARGGVAVGGGGGVAYGGARGGVVSGPFGGASAGGARGGTVVTPGGTTIQGGKVGGVSRGPLGGTQAGSAQGVRVTTPNGRTYTNGSAGFAGVSPLGGVRVGGASGTAVSGPFGSASSYSRGGVAVGPGGYNRGVAVGHTTRYVSPTSLRTSATYVRTGYHYNCFTPTWYRGHTAVWVAPRWTTANCWVAPPWRTLSTYCGIAAPPISYDYGSTVVIENNNVYVNGDASGSAEQYADQASSIANFGRQAQPEEKDEFAPLGVFGMIRGDEQIANHIFQLALNKNGIVRGNYYDAISDSTLPVYGSVDRKTQRVAWSIGDKKEIVFEAGLTNLTDEQTTVLIHYGKDRTDQMTLVRLPEPTDEKK